MDRPQLHVFSGRGEPSPPFRAFSLGVRSSSIPICLRLSAPRIPLSLAVVIVAAEEVDDEGEAARAAPATTVARICCVAKNKIHRRNNADHANAEHGKLGGNVLLWRRESPSKPAQTESRQGWGIISLIVRTAFFSHRMPFASTRPPFPFSVFVGGKEAGCTAATLGLGGEYLLPLIYAGSGGSEAGGGPQKGTQGNT